MLSLNSTHKRYKGLTETCRSYLSGQGVGVIGSQYKIQEKEETGVVSPVNISPIAV